VSETDKDVVAMRAALDQALLAQAAGEVPVGAVIVIGGEIVAVAHNRSITDSDPSGHAEIVALRAAAKTCNNYRLGGATLYVTLEPCVMCVGAITQARITRLVFDLTDSKACNHRFEVNGGVLAHECGKLLQDFFAHRR
jgi:tRNA(adenine34) deaminase